MFHQRRCRAFQNHLENESCVRIAGCVSSALLTVCLGLAACITAPRVTGLWSTTEPALEGDAVDSGTVRVAGVAESTQFDAVRFDLASAAPGFVIVPPAKAAGGPHPWLWYAPDFYWQIAREASHRLLQTAARCGLLHRGGGGGRVLRQPEGHRELPSLLRIHRRDLPAFAEGSPAPPEPGQLDALQLAVEHPESVACVAGIYTVCSITSYPGVDKAAPAYQMSPEALQASLKEHDPIKRIASLAAAKVPLFLIHGDSDVVVPIEKNAGTGPALPSLGWVCDPQDNSGQGPRRVRQVQGPRFLGLPPCSRQELIQGAAPQARLAQRVCFVWVVAVLELAPKNIFPRAGHHAPSRSCDPVLHLSCQRESHDRPDHRLPQVRAEFRSPHRLPRLWWRRRGASLRSVLLKDAESAQRDAAFQERLVEEHGEDCGRGGCAGEIDAGGEAATACRSQPSGIAQAAQ